MNRTANLARRAFIGCAASLLLPGSATAAGNATVLILGDSLSAEYGLPRGTGWASLLAERLATQRINAKKYSVLNASISGETTIGGRSRLPALLGAKPPALVVIELGANDGLRGLPLDQMRANLQAMVDACHAAGARALLIGMQIPPNYGRAYADHFAATFAEVAHTHHAWLVPFLLAGFAGRTELFQADQLHPNERAQPLMLEAVWPVLVRALSAAKLP
jgi:acyl-CoA thioesterase-1